jgi:hypothetical protein
MDAMTDEALAMTVAESTMQDWLTALTVMKQSPAPIYVTPAPTRHPVVLRPRSVAVRVATTSRPRGADRAQANHDESAVRVAGARTAYWLGLAVALGVLTFL